MGNLSAVAVRNAKARKDEAYVLNDGDGLRLRITSDGAKTWQVRYTVKGKERIATLPRRYGPKTDDAHLSLEDARHEASTIQALARDDIDFQDKKKADRAAEQARALNVQDLFDVWIAEISVKRGKKGRKDGGAEARRALEKDALPALGKKLLTQISRADVLKTVRRVSDRGCNRLSVMVLRDLKQMFRYGEANQPYKRLLAESDVLSIDDEDVVRGEYDNVRTRVLSKDEIIMLRDRLPASGLTAVVKAAVWVMTGCGTRVGETVAAEWKHVDLTARTWSIPKENTKTQTAIVISLSDFVLRQFKALWDARQKLEDEKKSDWVFPSRTDRMKPLNSQTVGKALADRQREDGKPIKGRTEAVDALILPGGEWRCHDLRRTAATQMQAAGVTPEIVHRCLNHAPVNKLDDIYLHYDYSEEMKAAWAALGDRLDALLSNNVIVGNFAQSA